MEPCHWSEGYVGESLQERQATMQVMLGMSLRAIWDATLVHIIIMRADCTILRLSLRINQYIIQKKVHRVNKTDAGVKVIKVMF